MTRQTKLVITLAVAGIIAVLLTSWGFAALSKNSEAPNFKAQTVTGKQFELKDLRGRVVVLDFWATWCPACRYELPQIEKLSKEYKDKGLVVIGIAVDSGSAAEVRRFAEQNKLTYWMVSDQRGDIVAPYQIRSIPLKYVVDAKGVIRQTRLGPISAAEFGKEIAKLLPSPEQLAKLKPLDESEARRAPGA